MENSVDSYKKYIHIDNGGIEIDIQHTEYQDFNIVLTTSYCGYPHLSSSLHGLNFDQLEEISKFLSNHVAKLKLKR